MTKRAISIMCGVLAAALVALAACGTNQGERAAQSPDAGSQPTERGQTSDRPKHDKHGAPSRRVDPRAGGFDISLGEWAVTPETAAIRPGRATFVITNRGTMNHGFEMETNDDHSGSGGGEGFKFETRLIGPGESVKVHVDLAPGVYKIECLVEGHDDMGMENILRVTPEAPLVAQQKERGKDSDVSIENFAFAPGTLEVQAGTRVTWVNNDPTEHTVTDGDASFESDVLAPGDEFTVRLDEPGIYNYRCAIHPDMTARIRVSE